MEKKTNEEIESTDAASNPLYQGTRGAATNPLYQGTRGVATNPLYQGTRGAEGTKSEAETDADEQKPASE